MLHFKEAKYKKSVLILLCALVYFVSYFARKNFAAVLAELVTTGTVEKSIGGLVGTAMFIFYGVGQLISGYLGDKTKPELLITVGIATTAVCNLLMPLLPSAYLMIPVWAINGLAQAMLWPPIVRILADNLKHEDFVRANLVVTVAAHIATILLYLYVPVCIQFMSWKAVFFTASALSTLVMAMFIVLMIIVLPKNVNSNLHTVNKKEMTDTAKKSTRPYTSLLISSGIIPLFFCIICMGFLRDGIESWLPTLYCEAFGKDAAEGTLMSVILPIFSILSTNVITALHKKPLFNNEAKGSLIVFALSALLCIPVYLLIETKSYFGSIICLVLAALVCACMHACNFLLISCMPGRFAKHGKAATTSGFSNACTYIGAAISMYGIAFVSDVSGWSGAIILWATVSLVGVPLCLISMRKYTKFTEEE